MTLKLLEVVNDPYAFVMLIGPVVAPLGTLATIIVPFCPVTTNGAFAPPIRSTVGPLLRFTP